MGRRRTLLLAVAIATALGATACAHSTTGRPQPVDTAHTRSSGGHPSDNWWRTASPCALLHRADAARLGFPDPGKIYLEDEVQRECDWDAPIASMGVQLTGSPYSSMLARLGTLYDLTIGGRPAKEDYSGAGGSGNCAVSVEATPGSQAMVSVDMGPAPTDPACQLAQQVAAAIVPNLPPLTK